MEGGVFFFLNQVHTFFCYEYEYILEITVHIAPRVNSISNFKYMKRIVSSVLTNKDSKNTRMFLGDDEQCI